MAQYPDLKVELAYVTTPFDTVGNIETDDTFWLDITSYVLLSRGVTIRRGRQNELDSMRAGTASFTVDNRSRIFETGFAFAPTPMRRIRISGVWNGTTYPVFDGFTTAWDPDETLDGMLTRQVQCVDALGAYFALQKIGGTSATAILLSQAIQTSGGDATYNPNTPVTYNRPLTVSVAGTLTGSINVAIEGTPVRSTTVTTETITLSGTNPSAIFSTAWYVLTSIKITNTQGANVGKVVTVTSTNTVPAGTSSAAIQWLLNATAWNSVNVSLDTGVQSLAAFDVTGGTFASYFENIATCEQGTIFVTRDGILRFRNRNARSFSITPVLTWSNLYASAFQYGAIRFSTNDQYVFNEARVTRNGGTLRAYADPGAVNAYGQRTIEKTGLYLVSDSDSVNLAFLLATTYRYASTRIVSLQPTCVANPATHWPAVLAPELSDLHAVVHQPKAGGNRLSYAIYVEAISYTIRETGWQTELSFGRAQPYAPKWKLEDGFGSILDQTTYLG